MPTLDPTATAHLDTQETTKPAFFAYLDILGDPIRATTVGHDVGFWDGTKLNFNRNTNMQGAVLGVIGAGGVVPSRWNITPNNATGVTVEIVRIGVGKTGFPALDVRFFGTNTSGVNATTLVDPMHLGQADCPLVSGETATVSAWLSLVGGSIPTVGSLVQCHLRNSSNAFVEGTNTSATGLDAEPRRYTASRTAVDPTVAKATFGIRPTIPVSATVDFTIRVEGPMMEKAATACLSFIANESLTGPAGLTGWGVTGDPDMDGYIFRGVDPRFVNIGDVVNQEGGSDTLTCSLSGLLLPDADLLNTIANPANWRGRAARLWVLVRDENDAAQGAVAHYYTGYMVSPELKPGRDQQTIELKIENYLALLTQASNRSYLGQSEYDPADTSARATIGAANGVREGPAAMLGTPIPHDLRSIGPGGIHPV